MTRQALRNNRSNSRSSPTGLPLVLVVATKGVCGALLVLMVLAAWVGIVESARTQATIKGWDDDGAYAVFYPWSVANAEEAATEGETKSIGIARDLYPVADAEGAIFVEADSCGPQPEIPGGPLLPVCDITVNTNYLDRYPILDEHGRPVVVDPDEKAWVVAVPVQYKSQENGIRSVFHQWRAATAQGEEQRIGPVAEEFRNQEVRIVWTESGQRVFSFNTTVNPNDGNMVVDPIVSVMTPANSMVLDRINSVTGDSNTALKIRVDGDPAGARRHLTPLLKELDLDDNLKRLVTPNQIMLEEVARTHRAVMWTTVAGGVALVVMLGLSVSFVSIFCDRHRRRHTVRRLHGIGTARTYHELFTVLGTTWLALGLVCVGVVLAATGGNPPMMTDLGEPTPLTFRLFGVLAVVLFVDVLVAVAAIRMVERRNLVRRVKEM